MEITIEWQRPIQLTRDGDIVVDDKSLPQELADEPGLYFFARRFGDSSVPFYVGESLTLRTRLRQHLNSRKIVDVLRSHDAASIELKKGVRYFHFGYLRAKPGQQAKVCCLIVQKQMIREAIDQKHELLNLHLTDYDTHTIIFEGSVDRLSIFARRVEVEA